ncbi:hypothetical protein [Alishewanella sp. HL-SH05]|uniref:hypothetical protein n=1 Tax=Alishewanella sp. HL-SH05 TaxID=3461145 RepID=UPI004040F47B
MSETKIIFNYGHVLSSLNIPVSQENNNFLNFINCPTNLLRLHVVLKNTIACLSQKLISEIENNPILKSQASGYLNTALKLLPLVEQATHNSSLFAAAIGATQPEKALRGVISKNPLYTMLYTTDSQEKSAVLEFHQTILFIQPLVAEARKSNIKIEFKNSDFIRMSIGYRHLIKSDIVTQRLSTSTRRANTVQLLHVFLDMLAEELRAELSLPSASKELKSLRKDQSNPLHDKLLIYDNAKYVRRVIGLIRGSPIQRRNVGRKTRTQTRSKTVRERIGNTILTPFTLAELDDEEPIIYGLIEATQEPDPEALLSGEVVDEDDTGTFVIIDESIPLESYVHEFHQRRVSNDTLKRLERQNNYVPYSLQLLSPQEIQKLMFFLASEQHSPLEQIQQIVLMCMFFTASPLENAIELRVVNEIKDNATDTNITYDLSNHHWIIPAFDLKYKTHEKTSDCLKVAKYLRLPASQFCAATFERFRKSNLSSESKIVGFELEELKPTLQATVDKTIQGKQGGLARISNHMLIMSCQIYGQATTTLLYNRAPPGSIARSYYTTLSTQTLKNRYTSLLKLLAPIIKGAIQTPTQIIVKKSNQQEHIGSQWHPDYTVIQKCIETLKTNTIKYSELWADYRQWYDFHNLFTLYVLFCTGLQTGLRPLKTPIVVPENIILPAKVFIRREKSQSDEFNTRYIPLVNEVIEQMQHYEEHLLAVKGRLIRLGTPVKQIPRLFFLEIEPTQSDKLKIVPFSVSSYDKQLSHYIDAPVNSNRRLLRVFLEDPSSIKSTFTPVPHEIIDAVLGHANIGEQFWSSSSTLSMRAIYQTIEPYITELSNILGIKVIQGMPS